MADAVEHDEYVDWLARYRRAWIERDAVAASRLFTEDATYCEQPFQAPFVGRALSGNTGAMSLRPKPASSFVTANRLSTVVVWRWNGGRTCRPTTVLSLERVSSCRALPRPGNVVSCGNTGS